MNAKERALKHRAKLGAFFKAIGSGIATGAKAVNTNVLAPAGTYVKTIAIGERDIAAEQEQLKRERLTRFGLDPKSALFQNLMKDSAEAVREEDIKAHVIIMARVGPVTPETKPE